jgi:LuxR family transcriptional regulator, quorum-sensing system regulator CciR
MSLLNNVYEIATLLRSCPDFGTMRILFEHLSAAVGSDFYALHQHPVSASRYSQDLRIHNYPPEWEECYDRRRLGLADPVHRASHLMACGFLWREVAAIVPLGDRDHAMIEEGRQFGLVDGFTIPVHVPGDRPGSLTFAFKTECCFTEKIAILLDGLAHTAFQRARILAGCRPAATKTRITDRQLEIVVLIGQDKTNGEIGDILGIKEDTVMKHIQNICGRFDAVRRASLPLRAVYEGFLIFSDILV